MEKISEIWFDDTRIYIRTDATKVYSRPLEAFPTLLEASNSQRLNYQIGRFGDDIRWASLDEDIHIYSFTNDYTEPNYDNELARIFALFPELNVSGVARSVGINKSLLSKYIYGIKKPSEARKQQILSALKELGQALITTTNEYSRM